MSEFQTLNQRYPGILALMLAARLVGSQNFAFSGNNRLKALLAEREKVMASVSDNGAGPHQYLAPDGTLRKTLCCLDRREGDAGVWCPRPESNRYAASRLSGGF